MASKEDVQEKLKTVMDPEIGLDVFTLGLIYDIKVESDSCAIKMTLTSPMCPYGPMIIEEIRSKTKEVMGSDKVEIELTFDPPWQPPPEVRLMMGV